MDALTTRCLVLIVVNKKAAIFYGVWMLTTRYLVLIVLTQVDLTSGMSIEAKRQIEELQRRIHVLEKQNVALSAKARNLQDHSTSTSFDQGPPGACACDCLPLSTFSLPPWVGLTPVTMLVPGFPYCLLV